MVSLVESALAKREPEWRARDLALERAGQLRHQRASGSRKRRTSTKLLLVQPEALALRESGHSFKSIARQLGVSRETVKRALERAPFAPPLAGVAEALAAKRDSEAVRGATCGCRSCERKGLHIKRLIRGGK